MVTSNPSNNTYYLFSSTLRFNASGSIYQYNGGSYVVTDTYNFAPISIQNFSVDNSLKLVGKYTPFINKRSLIPNQVYNFFIHFVRADGSHTNGIQIPNNVSPLTYTITGNTTIDNLFDLRFKWNSTGNSIIVNNLIMQIL